MRYIANQTIGLGNESVYPGAKLHEDQLEGVDIERLLSLGAISPIGEVEADPETELEENIELSDMTREQLIKLAEQMEFKIDKRAKQADLVEAISEEIARRTAIELGIDIEGMDIDAVLDAIAAKHAE